MTEQETDMQKSLNHCRCSGKVWVDTVRQQRETHMGVDFSISLIPLRFGQSHAYKLLRNR